MGLSPFLVETNYQINYYVSDVLLALSCILTIWILDVRVEKEKSKNLMESARSMLNPSFILLVLMVAWVGITTQVSQIYVPVYLQDDLGASSDLIGMNNYEQHMYLSTSFIKALMFFTDGLYFTKQEPPYPCPSWQP